MDASSFVGHGAARSSSALPLGELFADCISESLDDVTLEFQWDRFFKRWFRDNAYPCYFLFKRHLGVTNTQYVELFSLLESHSSTDSSSRIGRLLFHRTEQIRANLVESVNALLDVAPAERQHQIRAFAQRYAEIFASTVAVDMFYCSCAVFMPPGIKVDLLRVCADAGYIHSAGRPVYIRNIAKARTKDFLGALDYHLERAVSLLPVPFVVYSHEDFSGHDKNAREQISRGIEGTKLHLEKMSMGPYRLAQIVSDMRRQFAGRLTVPEAGPYDQVHTFRSPSTIWLIADRSIVPDNPTSPGRDRYYICYEQLVKNENPFFFFDENKPAWKSHTTLPHSLTAALINITGPHVSSMTVCDPFGGTCTAWLEAKRMKLAARIQCSDNSAIAPLLAIENLKFFLMPAEALRNLLQQLNTLVGLVRKGNSDTSDERAQQTLDFGNAYSEPSAKTYFLEAIKLLHDLRHEQPSEEQEFNFSEQFVRRLERLAPLTRLLFWIALRAELRYQGGYKRKSVTFDQAFVSSLEELIGQGEQFLRVRELLPSSRPLTEAHYVQVADTYSSCVTSPFFLSDIAEFFAVLKTEVKIMDACDIEPGSINIIICDPPYGFNTTEQQAALADLYERFIKSAVQALRDGGHLVICLPSESYTGKDLPYCTRASVVINQVLLAAQVSGAEVYSPARSLPSSAFAPPYYWEAERALRRCILHFRVKKRAA